MEKCRNTEEWTLEPSPVSFRATVRDCQQAEDPNRWRVWLDTSLFNPEGGGQPGDRGVLVRCPDDEEPWDRTKEDAAAVLDTQKEAGSVVHYTDRRLEAGEKVYAAVDWDYRFDLMQQHSGEHLVSGMVHAKYGYDNVGFHLGHDVVTIDFNGILDETQLKEIETQVNRYIWKDLPTEILYPSEGELKTLEYRSKKEIDELDGEVRIVRFPGADTCACCGTHVARTGEIGMVRILSVVRFREGVRVEMICGARVLERCRRIEEQNQIISRKLSARPEETALAVKRLWEENFAIKGKLLACQDALFDAEAARWEGKGDVLLFREGLEPDQVRKLTDRVMNRCGGRCAVFSLGADGTYKYAMGEKDGDLRSFTREMNAALKGRGGGKPFFVQGSAEASKEQIQDYFRRNEK